MGFFGDGGFWGRLCLGFFVVLVWGFFVCVGLGLFFFLCLSCNLSTDVGLEQTVTVQREVLVFCDYS